MYAMPVLDAPRVKPAAQGSGFMEENGGEWGGGDEGRGGTLWALYPVVVLLQ
jgi:hypothetical protein